MSGTQRPRYIKQLSQTLTDWNLYRAFIWRGLRAKLFRPCEAQDPQTPSGLITGSTASAVGYQITPPANLITAAHKHRGTRGTPSCLKHCCTETGRPSCDSRRRPRLLANGSALYVHTECKHEHAHLRSTLFSNMARRLVTSVFSSLILNALQTERQRQR